MAMLLHEIEWSAPLLPTRQGADPVAELTAKLSPWFGRTMASLGEPMKFTYATSRLMEVAYFVTSQENSCRYCYGAARAALQIWGYAERQIQDLEQQATLADGTTRGVVEFARKLAKSNPSPARRDREALLSQGLASQAVAEIAGCVAKACFANRIATFLALPPNYAVERLAKSLLGRVFAPWFRRKVVPRKCAAPAGFANDGPCASIIAEAGPTHLALWLRRVTDDCLASPAIPRRSKELMLAVIARQLGSWLCEEETRTSLAEQGLPQGDTQAILSTLSSPALSSVEKMILRWTRETVWYEPKAIQASTRRLLSEVGEDTTVEAIGAAALCNSLARLSLVRQ